MFNTPTVVYIAIFHRDRLREFYPVEEFPDGFDDYRAAWRYIYSHNLPLNFSPVEIYV